MMLLTLSFVHEEDKAWVKCRLPKVKHNMVSMTFRGSHYLEYKTIFYQTKERLRLT